MSIFVSASALNDYVSCQNKVYYRIFEKGEQVPSKEMLMGTITHKVLEKAWSDKDIALTMARSLCTKNGLDIESSHSVDHFVHTYFDRFQIMVREGDKIEKRFKVKLYDDVFLVGVFDRITMGTIIDWKTNAKPPKRIDNNIQFILYDLAYNLIYGKKPDGLYLAALADGSLVRYSESQNHIDTVMNQLIPDFVKSVRSKSFTKTGLFNGACWRCPYKIPCLGGGKDELVYTNAIEE